MQYMDVLKVCGLFSGIDDIGGALRYLRARQRLFQRGEFILRIEDRLRLAWVVLDGEIECGYQDSDFNKYNMNHFTAGELFGEAMACAGVEASPMQVLAVTDCAIMFLDFGVLCASPAGYEHHARLAGNLLRMLSAKNLFLNQKGRLLSRKDLRGNLAVCSPKG